MTENIKEIEILQTLKPDEFIMKEIAETYPRPMHPTKKMAIGTGIGSLIVGGLITVGLMGMIAYDSMDNK